VNGVYNALELASFGILVFSAIYVVMTFALVCISFAEMMLAKIDRGEFFVATETVRRNGISVIAPAYNMAPLIVASARALLGSDYDPLEVLIVDDGSSDGTSDALAAAFDLVDLPVGDGLALETAPITSMRVARNDARLVVVRKENGGRSDAVNAGLNLARYDLVAMVDADTLLEADALTRIAEEFAADPDNVVGVGGTIRITNGSLLDEAAIREARLAGSGVEASQTAEYFRAFFGSRIAWSAVNGLLIISGAFGAFRRDLVRSLGGLSKFTLGEDMELVMRLHHRLRPIHPGARIVYTPQANAWTEVPTGLSPLRGQRVRWHVGLLDNLRFHRTMFFRPRYGAVGLLALPYTLLFEVLGPLIQMLGYVIVVVLLIVHQISWWYAGAFLVIALVSAPIQTLGAILIEDVGYERYRGRDLIRLTGWALLETLWYAPLTAFWRTWATGLVLAGRRPDWGSIPRGASLQEELPATAPLHR
jgi:cellulose synthase/poly-beta-1,6-N-acetylglucosamine synthase-like glycosyltransferase